MTFHHFGIVRKMAFSSWLFLYSIKHAKRIATHFFLKFIVEGLCAIVIHINRLNEWFVCLLTDCGAEHNEKSSKHGDRVSDSKRG